jgi:hypothetical protein
MTNAVQFPFLHKGGNRPVPDLAPIIPMKLSRGRVTIDVDGLVDSGADVSVLPFSIGRQFGVDWNSLPSGSTVGGAAGTVPSKFFALTGLLAHFPPVQLIFAWVQTDNVPLILGQTNFFLEFDVCFFRSQNYFQIQPRTP